MNFLSQWEQLNGFIQTWYFILVVMLHFHGLYSWISCHDGSSWTLFHLNMLRSCDYAAFSHGLYSWISCHDMSSWMVFHPNMMLHSSGYAAFSWGSLFVNFLSQWEQLNCLSSWYGACSRGCLCINFLLQWKQLNGFSSEHDASFWWLCCTLNFLHMNFLLHWEQLNGFTSWCFILVVTLHFHVVLHSWLSCHSGSSWMVIHLIMRLNSGC